MELVNPASFGEDTYREGERQDPGKETLRGKEKKNRQVEESGFTAGKGGQSSSRGRDGVRGLEPLQAPCPVDAVKTSRCCLML